MKIKASGTELKSILPFRDLFLQETNVQVRYNACHERGWTDSYLITLDGRAIGYGSVNGQEVAARDTVFEFYIVPPFRKYSSLAFSQLLTASRVALIECQSNDLLLSSMLYEFAENSNANVILFADYIATSYIMPGVVFRKARSDDQIFDHNWEPKGD